MIIVEPDTIEFAGSELIIPVTGYPVILLVTPERNFRGRIITPRVLESRFDVFMFFMFHVFFLSNI